MAQNWNWDSPETHEVMDDTCILKRLDEPMLTSEGNDLVWI